MNPHYGPNFVKRAEQLRDKSFEPTDDIEKMAQEVVGSAIQFRIGEAFHKAAGLAGIGKKLLDLPPIVQSALTAGVVGGGVLGTHHLLKKKDKKKMAQEATPGDDMAEWSKYVSLGALLGGGLGSLLALPSGAYRAARGLTGASLGATVGIHLGDLLHSRKTAAKRLGVKDRKALEKVAGSNLYLKSPTGETFSPSTKYHYLAQGKYTAPVSGVISPIKDDLLKAIYPGKGPAQKVSPELVDRYVKAYQAEAGQGARQTMGKRAPLPRGFFRKLLRMEPKTKWVPDKEGITRALNSPEYLAEHKKVLDWMSKHKGTGFTVKTAGADRAQRVRAYRDKQPFGTAARREATKAMHRAEDKWLRRAERYPTGTGKYDKAFDVGEKLRAAGGKLPAARAELAALRIPQPSKMSKLLQVVKRLALKKVL